MLFDDKGIRIDLRGDSPIAKDFRSKLLDMKRYKFPLRFRTSFKRRINQTGEREPFQSTVALYKGYFYHEDGTTEKIRYSRTNPSIRNKNLEYVEGSGDVVVDSMLVREDEMDKAYYMLYICPNVKRRMLVLEDKQEEARKAIEAASGMAAVWYYLNDPESPLVGNDEKIRLIALSLGIMNAENPFVSIEEVKWSLANHIQKGEANGDTNVNVNAFKEATSLPEYYKKRARIYRAIDSKILIFDESKMRFRVKYGDEYVKLMDITARDIDSPEDALLRVMDNNLDVKDLFDRALDKDGQPRGGVNSSKELDSMETLMSLSMGALHSKAKEYEIPSFGKKREVIISEILECQGAAKEE